MASSSTPQNSYPKPKPKSCLTRSLTRRCQAQKKVETVKYYNLFLYYHLMGYRVKQIYHFF